MKRYTTKGFKYEVDTPMSRLQELEDKIEDEVLVEVVRCKDCENYKTPGCTMWYECSECGGQWDWSNPNDYCNYGERKEK